MAFQIHDDEACYEFDFSSEMDDLTEDEDEPELLLSDEEEDIPDKNEEETTSTGAQSTSFETSQPCTKRKGNLRVLSTNCDSLLNKKDELLELAEQTQADIIAVTEVRPKSYTINPMETDFILDGYSLHSNLDATIMRGVAIYIINDKSHLVTSIETNSGFQEQVWVKMHLKGNDSLIIGCLYRSGSGGTENNDHLNQVISQVSSQDPSHLLICGDFNYKGINWTDDTGTTREEEHFIECIRDNFLFQHVTEPTRYRAGHQPSTLDLIPAQAECIWHHWTAGSVAC